MSVSCVFSVCGKKADSFISDLPIQYFVLIEPYFIYSYYLSIREIVCPLQLSHSFPLTVTRMTSNSTDTQQLPVEGRDRCLLHFCHRLGS